VLYERFVFGDPVQLAGAAFNSKDRSRADEWLSELPRRSDSSVEQRPNSA